MSSQTFSLASRIQVSPSHVKVSDTANENLTCRVKLNNGVLMPAIHLGVYLASGAEALQATQWALEVGSRPSTSRWLDQSACEMHALARRQPCVVPDLA